MTAQTLVVGIDALDEREIGGFLDSFAADPGPALAYHYPFYLRFLAAAAYPGAEIRTAIARDSVGRLTGMLPGLHFRRNELNVWLSLAYYGPNAGAIVPRGAEAVATALVGAALADARARECDSLTLFTPIGASLTPYQEALGSVDYQLDRQTHVIPLDADRDVSPWPKGTRRDIRRARALGVVIDQARDPEAIRRLWEIYRENCCTRGIPLKPREHLETLGETAGDHWIGLLARHQGQPVAGLVCLLGGGVISYYLPCVRDEARSLNPTAALLEEAVSIGRARGCRLLNFEASPAGRPGVAEFKRGCGGQVVPYSILVKLLNPGALERYRRLGPEALARAMPQSFIIPYEALK